jgi:hypothetical protein
MSQGGQSLRRLLARKGGLEGWFPTSGFRNERGRPVHHPARRVHQRMRWARKVGGEWSGKSALAGCLGLTKKTVAAAMSPPSPL